MFVLVGRKVNEKSRVASKGKSDGRLHQTTLFCLILRLINGSTLGLNGDLIDI